MCCALKPSDVLAAFIGIGLGSGKGYLQLAQGGNSGARMAIAGVYNFWLLSQAALYEGRSTRLGSGSLDSNPRWDLTLGDFGQERTSPIQLSPQSSL